MADGETAARPRKLSVVVISADFERVHYALVMASSAAAIGIPATVFFTMGAARALIRADANGDPGWADLPADGGQKRGKAVDADFRQRGVATFGELLDACVELGVRFMVCEMGLRAIGLERDRLRVDVPIVEGGVVTFLSDARADGTMICL